MDVFYYEIKILESLKKSTSIGLVSNSRGEAEWDSISCRLVLKLNRKLSWYF
jgi:hypothetical protein